MAQYYPLMGQVIIDKKINFIGIVALIIFVVAVNAAEDTTSEDTIIETSTLNNPNNSAIIENSIAQAIESEKNNEPKSITKSFGVSLTIVG